jgi:hypothetical protein
MGDADCAAVRPPRVTIEEVDMEWARGVRFERDEKPISELYLTSGGMQVLWVKLFRKGVNSSHSLATLVSMLRALAKQGATDTEKLQKL